MSQHSRRPLLDEGESLRRQFAQVPGLPFQEVLTATAVEDAFRAEGGQSYDCVYTPLTTVRLTSPAARQHPDSRRVGSCCSRHSPLH